MRAQELVLDMFAGVGPFAIALAPRASLVVAADLNPQAVLLMIENIRKNRARNVLPLLADARRLEMILPWKFDRIVMNLPLAGTEFLPEAFRLVQPGGTIHFYSLVSREGEHFARIRRARRGICDRKGGAVVLARSVARGVRRGGKVSAGTPALELWERFSRFFKNLPAIRNYFP